MREERRNKSLGKHYKIVSGEPDDKKEHVVIEKIKGIECGKKITIIESIYGVNHPSMISALAITSCQQDNM